MNMCIKRASMRLSLSVAAVVAATVCGGCDMLTNDIAAGLNDPAKRHPIAFASNIESLFVEVVPGTRGLSANQEADVYRFLERYKAESGGPLRITAPKSAAGHLASSGVMHHIEAIVRNAGIDISLVETRRQSGGPKGEPLEISYDRTVAVAPECADWGTNLGENRERLPFNNFGCATQRNFALNVANARDMQQPRQEMPRSSERRSATWTKYLSAETAAAPVSAPAASAGASATKP